jgi:two-component system, NtrC family, nitrogen regulation response regulator NtrX
MLTVEEKPIVSMARKNLPVCILDDEADLVDLTTDRLTKLGFPATGTTSPQDALQKIRLGGCRAVIADFRMPAMDGLAFLEKVLQYDPGIYVILVTGYYSVDTAIDAIKRGAYDYLAKPLDFARLTKTLDDLAELFTQRSHIRDLEDRSSRISNSTASSGEVRQCLKFLTSQKRSRVTTRTFSSPAPPVRARSSSLVPCTT